MKVRRESGATHSFRLTRPAADMVDRVAPFMTPEGKPYPRSLGGKSRLVSDAIIWCYGTSATRESYHELLDSRAWWVRRCEELENGVDDAPPPPWWRRILSWRPWRRS